MPSYSYLLNDNVITTHSEVSTISLNTTLGNNVLLGAFVLDTMDDLIYENGIMQPLPMSTVFNSIVSPGMMVESYPNYIMISL